MDFRIDQAGLVWQPCPRCGQDRIPSAVMIRKHDEFCPALMPFAVLLRDTPEDRERLIQAVRDATAVKHVDLQVSILYPAVTFPDLGDAIIEALRT